MMYPRSIPGYNRFRVRATPINTSDLVRIVVEMPAEFRPYVIGAFSILMDVNAWAEANGVSPEQMVDIANNEVVFMAICDAVADCIAGDTSVQSAINNVINNSYIGGYGGPPNDVNGPINNPAYNPSCDLDVLWSQSLQIVEYVHDGVVQFLQKIEVGSNAVELVDAILNSPISAGANLVYDNLGIDGLVQLVGFYQDALLEQYEAAYSNAYRDELACEIFCACQSDCDITPERLFTIMRGRVDAYLNIPSLFGDLLPALLGVEWNSNIIADGVFFLAFGSLRLGSMLLPNLANGTLDLLLRLAVDDASSDWQILCDGCPPAPCVDANFIQSDNAFIAYAPFGGQAATWAPGVGWVGGVIGAPNRQAIAVRKNVGPCTVSQVRITYEAQTTGLGNYFRKIQAYDGPTLVVDITLPPDSGVVNRTYQLSPPVSIDDIRVEMAEETSHSGDMKLTLLEAE